MGYFSRLDRSSQLSEAPPLPVAQQSEPEPVPAQPAAGETATPKAELPAEPAAPESAARENSASAVVALEPAPDTDDAAARRAHEEAEAKRKAEWKSDQREKRAAEQARLDRLAAMSDEDAIAASVQRVSADTEKLTRRNMKDCVSEHIQDLCRQDPALARRTMHPRKSMVRCFRYINRMAKEFIEKEMKANGVQPESGVYGDDVPDDMVYQWAVDYFNDPDAQEDREKEEKFTPRPYVGKSSKASKSAKPKAKKAAPKTTPKPKPQPNADGQLSFLEAAG